jgi:hypothetical protein
MIQYEEPATVVVRLKTPGNQVQKGLYAEARIKQFDHLLKAKTSLFASDSQFVDCYHD